MCVLTDTGWQSRYCHRTVLLIRTNIYTDSLTASPASYQRRPPHNKTTKNQKPKRQVDKWSPHLRWWQWTSDADTVAQVQHSNCQAPFAHSEGRSLLWRHYVRQQRSSNSKMLHYSALDKNSDSHRWLKFKKLLISPHTRRWQRLLTSVNIYCFRKVVPYFSEVILKLKHTKKTSPKNKRRKHLLTSGL